MYGSIARMRLKPGSEPMFKVQIDAIAHATFPGWLSSTVYRSDSDPHDVWLVVAFESRDAYRRHSESTNQRERYRRIRALLEADPEWFDGDVLSHVGPGAAAPQQSEARGAS